ncbi:MAG: hypothetical protein HOL22_00015 [Euryarchaeota archaeon]|jgi:hypothetical protein|nr:hypothetical protein [Euryarchaeota archaeon]HJL97843.1 hypothetical protein [Candidatus Poseidoniaceae archaeon]MBT5594474.1 hypothetical protein [Euryarchaeota archaeon]MBT5843841.1 hypothetical protein [Euryarchaeota archaeon]MBT6641476.1 hypothetical protein [Euryarchaeota archaeon]
MALKQDQRAAATELGYIFTFLLGVLLLTMFSLWAYEIETATRERWNENAIQSNMDDLAAAVERADEASRMGSVDYAEKVTWRLTEADETRMTLVLTDTSIELIDEGGTLDTNVSISGAGAGSHEGSVVLAGVTSVWIVHSDGMTTLQYDRPQSNE